MITFPQIVFACVISIVLGRALHAAWLNLGNVIPRKYKFPLGLSEVLFSVFIMCFYGYGGGLHVLGATLFLFPALRWMGDYLLNLLRGKSWDYLPARNLNYGSLADDFLRDGFNIKIGSWTFLLKVKGRHNQLLLRVGVLFVFGLVAYYIFNYA